MLARIRRWFSSEEVKSLGRDLDLLIDRHADFGHKLEGLQLKIERLENRERMADARSARGRPGRAQGALDPEEEEILRDLRSGAAEVVSTRGDPFAG